MTLTGSETDIPLKKSRKLSLAVHEHFMIWLKLLWGYWLQVTGEYCARSLATSRGFVKKLTIKHDREDDMAIWNDVRVDYWGKLEVLLVITAVIISVRDYDINSELFLLKYKIIINILSIGGLHITINNSLDWHSQWWAWIKDKWLTRERKRQ